ncbi:hypothetical protein K461DRAFT_296214 [Myriangium duriaei CBS 260.36]|uniref:RING-type domain-containing protein n=1 Tax=Myriangium duriaei CBS 260.36 TaxID=1168546 RepID=A0A9P4IUA3_9PEZI|nr:hypothetical protein K461DRAFT_296214 [Myriangium duriaei CBS 260.36]
MPTSKRRAETIEEGPSRKRQHVGLPPVDIESEPAKEQGSMALELPPAKAEGVVTHNSDADGSLKALTQLHHDFDNLRHTLTCKICEKLFYEPFVLSCGHTYCYRCLSTWFSSARKTSCPQCRVKVVQLPAPSYVVKEMVAIFVARPELLPDGETVEDHETWKREEAEFFMSERDNTDAVEGGLFRGMFKSKRHPAQALVDPSDNVSRCPRCHWEVADGECEHCGMTFDGEGSGLSDDEYDSDEDSDLDGIDDIDEDDIDNGDPDMMWFDGELSPRGSDDSESESDREGLPQHDVYHARAHQSALRANGQLLQDGAFMNSGPWGSARQWPNIPGAYHTGTIDEYADVSDDDDEDDEDEEDDDDEEGSMNGFIVDDDDNTNGEQTVVTINSGSASEPESESEVIDQPVARPRHFIHRAMPRMPRRMVIPDDDDEDEEREEEVEEDGSSQSGSGSSSGSESETTSTSEEDGGEGDEEQETGSEEDEGEDQEGEDEDGNENDDDDDEDDVPRRGYGRQFGRRSRHFVNYPAGSLSNGGWSPFR